MGVRLTTTVRNQRDTATAIAAAAAGPSQVIGDRMVSEVQARWGPWSSRSTGRSAAGFSVEAGPKGIVLRNRVPYVDFVHRSGERRPEMQLVAAEIEPILLPEYVAMLEKATAKALSSDGPTRRLA